MNEKVYVVLVTYNTEMDTLSKCIDSLIKQVDKIMIIDNSLSIIDFNFEHTQTDKIEIIRLYDNYGIAYAQNIGIKKAIENGAKYTLTSDQDTVYPNNYVEGLLKCFIEESKYSNIASISPIYTDENKEKKLQPMVYFKNGFLQKDYSLDKCASVSHVISSGMLIPCSVLKEIGLMDEKLFIDWVDTEWCWRAVTRGFKVIQTPHVQINHCLGNPSKNIAGRSITVHSSFRNYYKIRNAVNLFFYSDSLNFTMKFFTLQQILKMMIVHPLTSSEKIKEIGIAIKGILDGLFKRMG